jgi:hypothetical protein
VVVVVGVVVDVVDDVVVVGATVVVVEDCVVEVTLRLSPVAESPCSRRLARSVVVVTCATRLVVVAAVGWCRLSSAS